MRVFDVNNDAKYVSNKDFILHKGVPMFSCMTYMPATKFESYLGQCLRVEARLGYLLKVV